MTVNEAIKDVSSEWVSASLFFDPLNWNFTNYSYSLDEPHNDPNSIIEKVFLSSFKGIPFNEKIAKLA